MPGTTWNPLEPLGTPKTANRNPPVILIIRHWTDRPEVLSKDEDDVLQRVPQEEGDQQEGNNKLKVKEK